MIFFPVGIPTGALRLDPSHAIVTHMQMRLGTVPLLMFLLFLLLLPVLTYAQVPDVGAPSSCPNLTRDLQRGMSGSDVRELQQFLVSRGHMARGDMNTGPGFFGMRTEAAVKRFQRSEGVPATGYVGPLTRAAIARVCGKEGGGRTPPTVSMSASPVNGNAPLTVAFDVMAQASPCSSYILDFGDGQSQSLASFCGTRTIPHVYPAQGNVNAHLDEIVAGARVQRAQSTITVGAAVVPAPTCTISATKISIAPNEPTTITWSSTNATSAKWQDGSLTGTSGNAIFTDIATTTAKSITFTGTGGTKQCSITITVTAPKTGTIVASGNAIANGSSVTLPSAGQSAFKLVDFTLTAGPYEPVVLKKFVFTLRNQTGSSAPGAATVSNYRVTIGTNSYTVSVAKNGVYETGTVFLGSGVTFAGGQSLGVGIFADIVPNSGGNLDLWVYPADMEFVGFTSNLPIVPTSAVTNRVDTTLLYWSGWISVGTGSNDGGGANSACVLNGKPYPIDPISSCDNPDFARSRDGGGPGTGTNTDGSSGGQCLPRPYRCSAEGWVGSAVIYPTRIACLSSNSVFVRNGELTQMIVCTQDDPTQTNCARYAMCRYDGWWESDAYRNLMFKLDYLPRVRKLVP